MAKEARPLIKDALSVATLCCDPGFGSFGYGVVRYDKVARRHSPLEAGVIRTKKSPKKQRVLVTEDNFARSVEIAEALWQICQRHAVRAITFESYSMPQKAGKAAIVKIGYPYGALALLSVALRAPVVQMTPQQVKKKLCGDRGASKEDVERAVQRVLLGLDWDCGTVVVDGQSRPDVPGMLDVTPSEREHAWDSFAGYITALDGDVMRALCV